MIIKELFDWLDKTSAKVLSESNWRLAYSVWRLDSDKQSV